MRSILNMGSGSCPPVAKIFGMLETYHPLPRTLPRGGPDPQHPVFEGRIFRVYHKLIRRHKLKRTTRSFQLVRGAHEVLGPPKSSRPLPPRLCGAPGDFSEPAERLDLDLGGGGELEKGCPARPVNPAAWPVWSV